MTEPVLLRERRGAVLVLTLNRPGKLNALDLALTEALVTALEAADTDSGIRAVVVTGAGRAFCAGADMKEFADRSGTDAAPAARRSELYARLVRMVPELGTPVIAAVNGLALGGGCGLVLACDMAMAGDAATFGYPEIKYGIVANGLMPALARHAGGKAAFDLLATGRTVEAAEALRLGMVSRIVPADELTQAALATAATIADYPAEAIAEMKALLYRVVDLPLAEGLDFVRARKRD